MKMNLSGVEIRILGCLIEKELTTPENYPLSLNSLTNACNQKSNRAPLMELTEEDVIRGLDRLGSRGLARLTAAGGRVSKYRHSLTENLNLEPKVLAVLGELMLRGPQTAGELRNRADRMIPLADIAAVEETLHTLMKYAPPLVARLQRQPGQKEQRYAQLLAGEEELAADTSLPLSEPARPQVLSRDERLNRLDAAVSAVRTEISALKSSMDDLIAQFS